jgi:hypothetical protein
MKKREGAAAMLATWAASTALAAGAGELDIPKLRTYEQPTYRLVTHDEFTASHIPGQTARIDAFLSQQLATPSQAPGLPATILVLPRNVWLQYFETSDDMDSEFVPARFANYLLLQHSVNSHEISKALFHEYTHAFLRSQMKRQYPLWFEEGMATLIQYSRFHDTRVEIGMPLLASTRWIPISRLLQLDRSSPEYRSENQVFSVHYGSWSLVHRAFIEDPAFNKQLFDYLAALNNLNSIEKAWARSFDISMEQLDLRQRQYIQKASVDAFFEVKIPRVPKPKVPAGRDMSEAESLELLAEAMLAAGTKPARLAELIEAAHRVAPNSPRVLALRMMLAVRDRNDAALTRLAEENASRASDPLVARGMGLALFERVREESAGDTMPPAVREQLGRRAFEWLDRAVTGGPDDVAAIWGHAMLAARFRQDLPNALQRLNRGLSIASNNADLAMAAALVHEAKGEEKEMIPFLVVTARMTGINAQREWAIQRVNAILSAQAVSSQGK